jgi:hypothetical protein
MVWVALLTALWVTACVVVVALAHAAASGDRPTAEHLARTPVPGGWLAPTAGERRVDGIRG